MNSNPTQPAAGPAPYDSLWHLVAMGVLTPEHTPNGWSCTSPANRPTRVAVIDTSVAFAHPNLVGAVNTSLALDLFSARLGSFSGRGPTDTLGTLILGDSAALVEGLPLSTARLAELRSRLAVGQPAWFKGIAPATSAVFSAHVTAMAGLIGARPTRVAAQQSSLPSSDGMIALPYCGVDPTCDIIPISTNFDADPEALILAFLYADLINADVIVLPRVIPDPLRTLPELSPYVFDDLADQTLAELSAPNPMSNTEKDLWDELLEIIVRVSHRRPVVCAAGNANEEYGAYPANFASEENGLISVGAINAKGWHCSYSTMRNLTIWAPSTDAERWDRAEVRLDVRAPDYDAEVVPVPNNNDRYSRFDIISTDVPGMGGYSISPYPGGGSADQGAIREYGSYYCRFGGTSAASAQVAGLLSLAQSTGMLPQGCSGIEAKSWMLANAVPLSTDRGSILCASLNGNASFPDVRED